jgi:hypothetical protein
MAENIAKYAGRIRELEAEKVNNAQWVQQVQKLERQFEQLMSVKIDTK